MGQSQPIFYWRLAEAVIGLNFKRKRILPEREPYQLEGKKEMQLAGEPIFSTKSRLSFQRVSLSVTWLIELLGYENISKLVLVSRNLVTRICNILFLSSCFVFFI